MKNRAIILILFLIIVFTALIGYFVYKKNSRNAVDVFAENGKIINVLIAGSNVFNNNRHTFFAIYSFNSENYKSGLTLIPPELKIDLNGNKKKFNKINEIDFNDYKELCESLEKMTGLYIPFYIILYSPDIERIVDLLEGIDLFVMNDIKIPGISFGLNYFDGSKINQYINSVENNSIYKKYDRIMDILLTLYFEKDRYKKFLDINLITNVLKTVKTNMLAHEAMSLAELLYVKNSPVSSIILPGIFDENGFYVMNESSAKIYKSNFLSKLIIEDKLKPDVKIKILNGTDIRGLAKKVRNRLDTEGFKVSGGFETFDDPAFKESSYYPLEKSIIINCTGESAPAKKIADFLSIDTIYHSVDSSVLYDMILIAGKDMAKK